MALLKFQEFVNESKINEEYLSNDPGLQLIDAAKKGRVAAIKQMVGRSVDVNYSNPWGNTPLTMAVFFKKANSVKTLIEIGADVNKVISDGKNFDTAMDVALKSEDEEIINLLRDAGALTYEELQLEDTDSQERDLAEEDLADELPEPPVE